MRTRREFGQLIFGGSSSIPTAQRYGVYGGGNASCQRGTTTKDSWEPSPGKYRTEILIDGNDTPGEYNCDMPIAASTRVVVLMFSTQAVILPISSLILNAASQDAAAQDADVRKDLSDEITKRGEVIKADAVQDSKLYTDQTVNSLSTTIADTYQSKSDMASYATTSQLEQTSEDITSTFTASLNEKGKTYIGQPSPPYNVGDVWIEPDTGMSYTCTTARESGSYSSSDWTKHDAFVSSIIRQDVDGITVGNSMTDYEARVSASGRFQVLKGSMSVLDMYASGSTAIIGNGNSNLSSLQIQSYGSNAMLKMSAETGVVVSAMNGLRTSVSNVSIPSRDEGKVLGGTLLYSNPSGTQGSISLSMSASTFNVLEFVYGDGSRYLTGRLYSPNGKTVSLSRNVYSTETSELHMATNVYSVSGSSVSLLTSYCSQGSIRANGTCVANQSGVLLRVYQVIGWG